MLREWNEYANRGMDQYDRKYCLKAEFGDLMQFELDLFIKKGNGLDLIKLIECKFNDDFDITIEKSIYVVDALWNLARAMKGDHHNDTL